MLFVAKIRWISEKIFVLLDTIYQAINNDTGLPILHAAFSSEIRRRQRPFNDRNTKRTYQRVSSDGN